MYLLLELLVDFLLAFGIVMVRWCFKHKNITLAILAIMLVITDIAVLCFMIMER